ncbi:MAG: AEC family transporter [Solirubrobacterales bacterium]
MIWILLTIVVATAAGIYAERHWPERAGTGSRRGLLLILYFVLPPIVFFNLVHLEVDFAAGAGIGLGLVAAVLLGTLAWVIAVPVMKLPRPTAGAVICCAILANTSYLGYPMVYALMGGDALTEAVLFDVVVSYLTLVLGAFAVGAAFGTKAGEGFRERFRSFLFRNPLLWAAALALLAPDALAPEIAVDISRLLVLIPLVVGFFAVGAILTEESKAGVIKLPPRLHSPVAAVIALRLLVAPSLLFVLTLPLTGVPPSYFLLAAMPTGLNSMIVGHTYGLELRIMAESIVYTTTIVVIVAAGWAILA